MSPSYLHMDSSENIRRSRGATEGHPSGITSSHTSSEVSSQSFSQSCSRSSESMPSSSRRNLLVAGAVLSAIIGAGALAATTGIFSPDTLISLAAWFETLGPSAIYLYAGFYLLLELVAVPAIPLTLGAGYLFGFVKGTVAVSIASTCAAAAAFLISRYGLRDVITRFADQYPKFRAIDRAIEREGFKVVFLLRLSPLLPFSISNYLYGLTSVQFSDYVLGSWLGMMPGTIAYVSAGAAVSALSELGMHKSAVNPVLVVVGVLATIGVVWTIGKLAAEAIDMAEEEEELVQRH